jgi:hypothetical protein
LPRKLPTSQQDDKWGFVTFSRQWGADAPRHGGNVEVQALACAGKGGKDEAELLELNSHDS